MYQLPDCIHQPEPTTIYVDGKPLEVSGFKIEMPDALADPTGQAVLHINLMPNDKADQPVYLHRKEAS